ncbi:MAG: hypothetical protein JXI32_04640, partial [Deltaproteobacteria bacterium]|nr:hypothetical protein [Deltaproteobacteria bacterium]
LNGFVIANETTTAMNIGDTLEVRVNAPASIASVVFASTIGVWDFTSSVITVAVAGGKASATLRTAQAGIANVQVYDQGDPATSDTLRVAMTSGAAADKITLQASPTVVPRSVGTTTGSSSLIATVYDANGIPKGDAPVAFSIVNPTSGGETVSPVVVLTTSTTTESLSLGQAQATFTSGSLPSDAGGVQIRAAVVGTAVRTGIAPSGDDRAIIIGGEAASVAFGRAPVIESLNQATYALPMSVLVSDIDGNPVPNKVVSLSAWPIAWSTGTACAWDPDDDTVIPRQGTFFNEDINENVYRDPGEDGTRTFYADGTLATAPGTVDGMLTPVNSDGGVVPATVTTDENGVADFKLIYLKQRAIWTLTRIRASTFVQGTETRGEVIFRLPAEAGDVTPCKLGDSPYVF